MTIADIKNCYTLLGFLRTTFQGASVNGLEMDTMIRSLDAVLQAIAPLKSEEAAKK